MRVYIHSILLCMKVWFVSYPPICEDVYTLNESLCSLHTPSHCFMSVLQTLATKDIYSCGICLHRSMFSTILVHERLLLCHSYWRHNRPALPWGQLLWERHRCARPLPSEYLVQQHRPGPQLRVSGLHRRLLLQWNRTDGAIRAMLSWLLLFSECCGSHAKWWRSYWWVLCRFFRAQGRDGVWREVCFWVLTKGYIEILLLSECCWSHAKWRQSYWWVLWFCRAQGRDGDWWEVCFWVLTKGWVEIFVFVSLNVVSFEVSFLTVYCISVHCCWYWISGYSW